MGFELDGADRRSSLQQRLGDSMHAVHYTTVEPENDRVRQVHCFDHPSVVHDPPNRCTLELVVEPVDGVDLVDRCQLNVLDRQRATELDQPVDVPGIQALLSGPEVILLSHLRSIDHAVRAWSASTRSMIS